MKKNRDKMLVIVYAICSIALATWCFYVTGTATDYLFYFWITMQVTFSLFYFSMFFIWAMMNPPKNDVKARLDESPEEFKRILEYMEERNLLDYDGLKLKLMVTNGVYNACKWILIIGLVLIFSSLEGLGETVLRYGLLMLVVSIIGIRLTKKTAEQTKYEYKFLYKREIIPTLVNWMNSNLHYIPIDPEKTNEYEKLYIQSEFDKNQEYVESEDYIEGHVVANTYVKMADMKVGKEDSEGNDVRIFKGLFAHFDNINYLNYKEIAVRSEKDYYKIESLKTSTQNKEFNKEFFIYTSNDYAVKKMENTGFLDALLNLRNKYECDFDFIIREGEIYIQIDLDNVFEPDLWDRTKGKLPLYRHYLQYKLLFEIFFLVREFVETI